MKDALAGEAMELRHGGLELGLSLRGVPSSDAGSDLLDLSAQCAAVVTVALTALSILAISLC